MNLILGFFEEFYKGSTTSTKIFIFLSLPNVRNLILPGKYTNSGGVLTTPILNVLTVLLNDSRLSHS